MNHYVVVDESGAILCSGSADLAADIAAQVGLYADATVYTHDGPALLDDTRLEISGGTLVRKSGVTDGFDPSSTTMEIVES